ncbi:MAG TPA: hypothetical protein VNY05_14820 [Candidatus Acidoferrales bacterium]|jgi:hypothetical protein|nr:hypothetical protein [Candidatus Acidoferrales bacterium]
MNHQTVRLDTYDPQWQQLAHDLFQRVGARLDPTRLVQADGSYSVLQSTSEKRAAKAVIYQAEYAKGNWRPGPDGVYVCIRTAGRSSTSHLTVGFLPKSDERFSFFRIEATQDLDSMADFIVASADY